MYTQRKSIIIIYNIIISTSTYITVPIWKSVIYYIELLFIISYSQVIFPNHFTVASDYQQPIAIQQTLPAPLIVRERQKRLASCKKSAKRGTIVILDENKTLVV